MKKEKTGLSQRELYEKCLLGRTITSPCARQSIQYSFCVCRIYDFKVRGRKKHHNVDAFYVAS